VSLETTTRWEVVTLRGIDKVAGGDAGVTYEADPCCIGPNGGSSVNRTSPEITGEDLRRTTAVNAGRRQQCENHKGKRSTGSPGFACMLGEAGEGPERPDFAGDRRGRRGCGRRCGRSWLDSFMAYGEDDMLNILEVSSLRAGDHGSGATATMARSFSVIFQSLTQMMEDREKVGKTAAAQLGGYGEARVSPGTTSVGFKEEGEGSRAWRARCWKGSR
jgi:hypothetical protein